MRNSLAAYKENLSQIALDVLDAAQELDVGVSHASGDDASIADRRTSHRFAQSNSAPRRVIPNGTDSGSRSEIERCRSEIQRLQASEAEIKALSVNYAAMLKEKQEELSRLHVENSSLRKDLEATSAVDHPSRSQSIKTSFNSPTSLLGMDDQPGNRLQIAQASSRPAGKPLNKTNSFKHNMFSNGSRHVTELRENEKELSILLEEQQRSLSTLRATYEAEVKELKLQLDKERETLSTVTQRLESTKELNETIKKELQNFKVDKDKVSVEMIDLHNELNAKLVEIKRLQSELNRRDSEELGESIVTLRSSIVRLEKENGDLKAEKDKLQAALKLSENHKCNEAADARSNNLYKHTSEKFTELEKALNEVSRERDKAMQELSRLKQHLLDKELEESEKMDEDSKIIDELRAKCEYQRAQTMHLEAALKKALSNLEEAKRSNEDELQKANKLICDLKNQVAHCMSTIDSKNDELSNLETALGQYYAEIEAKERLGRELAATREESTRLSVAVKDLQQRLEVSKREKDETLSNLLQTERMLSDGKVRVQKLEDDNLKLRRALEQSMTRINRMSMDSDYAVDRRIVIKLLVTYFQRNHSKEVLDLMVRMLGFSEEDKQRIGFAQQTAGKSVVRGVLGLPGRLVGGILGGSSADASASMPSENQSFADLWVDFLLKETEERGKRETAEAAAIVSMSAGIPSEGNATPASTDPVKMPVQYQQISHFDSAPGFQAVKYPATQMLSPLTMRGNQGQFGSDSEFSTVPLSTTPSSHLSNASRLSRLPPR